MPVYYDQEDAINSYIKKYQKTKGFCIDSSYFNEWCYDSSTLESMTDENLYDEYTTLMIELYKKFPSVDKEDLIVHVREFIYHEEHEYAKLWEKEFDKYDTPKLTISTSDKDTKYTFNLKENEPLSLKVPSALVPSLVLDRDGVVNSGSWGISKNFIKDSAAEEALKLIMKGPDC